MATRILCALLTLALIVPAWADVEFPLGQITTPAGSARGGSENDPCTIVPITAATGRAASAAMNGVEPGRYTVTFRLAAPPFGKTPATVECVLDIPGQTAQRRVLTGADFPPDDTARAVTFDAILLKPSAVRVAVEWRDNGEKELTALAVYPVTLVRKDRGVAITALQPDKLLYLPGEAGKLRVTVHNFTDTAAECRLLPFISTGFSRAPYTAAAGSLTLAPGEDRAVDLPFTADATDYGHEAAVALLKPGTTVTDADVLDRRSDVYNVSDNVWKVAIGASGIGIMGMSGTCNPGRLEADLRICREQYFNWWEKMFWPPDDWGDMTPDRNEWISGQSVRWENAQMIKDFIALAKANGIKSVSYGKHGTGGPEGWELTRAHYEWFYTNEQGHPVGGFNTWDLAYWHDIKQHLDPQGRKKYASDWHGSMPDFRQTEPLEWGIKELVESSKTFGWDGVRFDGHWTAGNDDLSTANMRRLKEALWAYDPHYVFGFNQSWSFGHQTSSTAAGMVAGYNHELRESLAGGGMYMQEAIGGWTYGMGGNQRYTTWKDYGTKEIVNAQGVRNLGGSYHFIYGSWNLLPVDRLYKFVLGTAAGIHPVYGDTMRMPGCPNWGRFLTRWSGVVWDTELKPLAADSAEVTTDKPLWWKEWTKERIVDAKTRQVIVHLIVPPPSDVIDVKQHLLLPAPVKDITLKVKVPAGQQAGRVALLDPQAENAQATTLTAKVEKGWVTTTVPRVDVWSVVVFEFSGKFTPAPPPSRFTEAPDPAKVAEGRTGAGRPMGFDPLRPDDKQSTKNQWIFETDTSYNSCPGRGTTDPDAVNGVAQVREKGERGVAMGRSWCGPLPAGKYVAHLRIKCEGTGRQAVGMRLLIHGIFDKNYDFASADYHRTDAAHTLIADGKYHDYDIPFECPKDGLAPCFLGGCNTDQPDDSRCFMDRITLDLQERYTDAQQGEKMPMTTPAGLAPGGAPGLDVLVVKGWTWDTYGLGEILPKLTPADRITEVWSSTGEAINFPQTYEDLYKYDLVILCNVGAYGLQYPGRKVLKDFVEAGGGLILLGGSYTLGQGNLTGTYLADMLPVEIKDGLDVQRAVPPLGLQPGAGTLANGITAAQAKEAPAVYWRHQVTAKLGATVQVVAGKEPLLTTWTAGKGRVAVFSGTALGRKQAGETPFWNWSGWPTILRNMVTWAGRQ
jgi:uncharacterized membrane protein